MGGESQLAPAAVALLFTAATVALLYASVSILRSPAQGCLAALMLLGTKFFIVHGAAQYADVPFGFFMLAGFALVALSEAWPEDRSRLLAAAGLAVGLSAWTKNEGLLLLPALSVGYGLVSARARGWRMASGDAGAFAIGLAPVLALVLGFKLGLAPPNDLMADQGIHQTAGRLLEGSRYLQVLAGFGQGLLEVTARGLLGVLLLVYLTCAGGAPAGPSRLGGRITAGVLALVLAGYVAVLLAAPTSLLATNLRSTDRLLLQLWPSALLAYFLSVRTPEEAGLLEAPLSQAEEAARRSERSLLPLSEAS
jgi:hypothetical protein